MALARGSYFSSSTDAKLLDAFKNLITSAFDKNGKFGQVKDVMDVIQLYRVAFNDPDIALSTITDEMVQKILEPVTDSFKKILINELSIQTDFKNGSPTALNCNVRFNPIRPFIEVLEESAGQEVHSIKFWFEIYMNGCVTGLHFTRNAVGVDSIDIKNIGLDCEFYLVKVTTSYFKTGNSDISYASRIKLYETTVQINNLSFPLRNRE